MLRRRHEPETPSPAGKEDDRMHEWVLSLPWVVELPDDDGAPGVRYFAVDCEPLGRRQVWLLVGLTADRNTSGLAVVLPLEAAADIEQLGFGRTVALVSDQLVLVALTVEATSRRQCIEAVVLTAYCYAMS
jgi:hypothetical protein